MSPLESHPTVSYIRGRGRPKKYDVGKNPKRDLLRRLPPPVRRDVSDDDLVQIMSSLGEDSFESEPYRTLHGGYHIASDRFANMDSRAKLAG